MNSPDTLARSFKVSRGGVALNEPISPAPQQSAPAPAATITTSSSSSTSSAPRVSYEKPQPLSNGISWFFNAFLSILLTSRSRNSPWTNSFGREHINYSCDF